MARPEVVAQEGSDHVCTRPHAGPLRPEGLVARPLNALRLCEGSSGSLKRFGGKYAKYLATTGTSGALRKNPFAKLDCPLFPILPLLASCAVLARSGDPTWPSLQSRVLRAAVVGGGAQGGRCSCPKVLAGSSFSFHSRPCGPDPVAVLHRPTRRLARASRLGVLMPREASPWLAPSGWPASEVGPPALPAVPQPTPTRSVDQRQRCRASEQTPWPRASDRDSLRIGPERFGVANSPPPLHKGKRIAWRRCFVARSVCAAFRRCARACGATAEIRFALPSSPVFSRGIIVRGLESTAGLEDPHAFWAHRRGAGSVAVRATQISLSPPLMFFVWEPQGGEEPCRSGPHLG